MQVFVELGLENQLGVPGRNGLGFHCVVLAAVILVLYFVYFPECPRPYFLNDPVVLEHHTACIRKELPSSCFPFITI